MSDTPKSKFTISRLLLIVALIALCIAMADRGNYLLGLWAGCAFFTATFCVCYLWYQIVAAQTIKNKRPKIAFLSVVTVVVAVVLVQPTLLNENIRYGLSDTQEGRDLKRHVNNVLASTPACSDLTVKYWFHGQGRGRRLKVTVTGATKTKQDLKQFLDAAQEEYFFGLRLSWRVRVHEDGKIYTGKDDAFTL